MEQVRQAMGADAVIMSSKKVTGGVEVVAAQDYVPPEAGTKLSSI